MRTGRRNKTLVYVAGGGRFGNQLMAFGHLIAIASEYPQFRIFNPNFWPYSRLCEGTRNQPASCFPPEPGSLWRLPAKAAFALSERSPRFWARFFRTALPQTLRRFVAGRRRFDDPADRLLGAEALLERFPGRKHLIAGYNLRAWPLFAKHRDIIRGFLQPAEPYRLAAQSFLAELRGRYQTVIGLAIRQTDYRVWEGGRFFIPSDGYRKLAEQLLDRFGPEACLVVTCDEGQPADLFEGLPAVYSTGAMGQSGHYMDAFAQLAECDVVASVPSTFSCWAAFFGNKPMLVVDPAHPVRETACITDALCKSQDDQLLRIALK